MRNKTLSKSMGCLPDRTAEGKDDLDSHDDDPNFLLAPPALNTSAPEILAPAAELHASSSNISAEASSRNTSVDDNQRSGVSTATGNDSIESLKPELEEEEQTALLRDTDGVQFCVLLREEAQSEGVKGHKKTAQSLVHIASERSDTQQPLVSVTSFKLTARPAYKNPSRAAKVH